MNKTSGAEQRPTITAARALRPVGLDAANPDPAWQYAEPVHFHTDWRGKKPDPALETEVRMLWSPETLYLRFACHYREIFVFDDYDPNGRRDCLWERDVVEAFLQPPEMLSQSGKVARNPGTRFYAFYTEFEVAPNGSWLDLRISPAGGVNLESGLRRSVHLDQSQKIWTAELAVPARILTKSLDPKTPWRANFYRIEGRSEPRAYLAWSPTMTAEPDFHVPKAFGVLKFEG